MAIRDFLVCGVAVFCNNSEIGYGLIYRIPTIILFYLCHKNLLHFFLLDNTLKVFESYVVVIRKRDLNS